MSELAGHELRISGTISECEKLISQSARNEELRKPLDRLETNWKTLKDTSEQRKRELEDALNEANYFSEASEAEIWMNEKEQLIGESIGDLGKDEDAAESMLKRHMAMMVDVKAFGEGTVYGDLK